MICHFCKAVMFFVMIFSFFSCRSVYLTDLDPMGASVSFLGSENVSKKSLENISVFVSCENSKDWDGVNRTMDWCRKIKKSIELSGAKIQDDAESDHLVHLKVAVRKINQRSESSVDTILHHLSYWLLPIENEEIFEFKILAMNKKNTKSFSDTSKMSMKNIVSLSHKPMLMIRNYFESENQIISDYLSQVRYSRRLYKRVIRSVLMASSEMSDLKPIHQASL